MESGDGDTGRANNERCRVEADTTFKIFLGEETETADVNQAICEAMSDTGELYINREKNYGYVDTAMTKCAYGFLGKNSPP